MSVVRLCVLLAVVVFVGCSDSVPVTPPPPPQAKAILLDIAKQGEINSGIMAVREDLERMKATDSAKADTMLKELDQLERMSNPQQIKTKAKEMADKL